MADEIYPTSSPNPVAALGYDGTDFRTLAVDADGHTQIDILTAAADSGLATQTTLASILTELGEKLEVGQLSIEDVTKYLNVVVKTCALPSGASTALRQDEQTTLLDAIALLTHALGSVSTDSLVTQPGVYGASPKPITEDVDGHPQVDVLTSALPTGAATSAKQDTMITALQLIDDLRAALASVATDKLKVKGEDQLFGFKDQVLIQVTTAATAAGMTITTDSVPAGEIWEITHVSARNNTRAAPTVLVGIKLDAATYYWFQSGSTTGAGVPFGFAGHMCLKAGNRVAVYIGGCTVDDALEMNVNGLTMTKEA